MRTPCVFIALLTIVSAQTIAAEVKLVVHPRLGTYALVVEREDPPRLSISVFDRANAKTQEFEVESTLKARDAIRDIDVDGDGYKDLVIAHSYGAGPFASTSLYRFNVNTGRFKEDDSFPGEGFPTPSRKRACFYLESRLPPGPMFNYEITEWCLSRTTDQWVESTSCNMKRPCFKRLENYMRTWHKKNAGASPP